MLQCGFLHLLLFARLAFRSKDSSLQDSTVYHPGTCRSETATKGLNVQHPRNPLIKLSYYCEYISDSPANNAEVFRKGELLLLHSFSQFLNTGQFLSEGEFTMRIFFFLKMLIIESLQDCTMARQ